MATALKIARTAAGLTQEQLAREAGVAGPYLGSVERGVQRPGRHFRKSVAGALELSERLLFPDSVGTASTAKTAG